MWNWGHFRKRMLNEVAGEQVVSNDGDAEGSETVAAVGTGLRSLWEEVTQN